MNRFIFDFLGITFGGIVLLQHQQYMKGKYGYYTISSSRNDKTGNYINVTNGNTINTLDIPPFASKGLFWNTIYYNVKGIEYPFYKEYTIKPVNII